MFDRPPITLVTGAGSGLGLESALYLAERNFAVYGTVLTPGEAENLREQSGQRGVVVRALHMDVTRRADIDRTVDAVLGEAGRIDAVVHFAGMGLRGFFEDLSMEEIRRLYDVNVFGIMELTQAILPHMRRERAGRIVIVSSAAGRMGSMSIAGYSSGKFAVEGLGECLHQEMKLLGIHVSLLEPGLIYTPHFGINRNRARRAADPASPYYFWFCQHEALVDKLLANNRFTAVDIARTVHKILTARRPKLRYMVGFKPKLLLALRDMVPGEIFQRIYWSLVRRMVASPRNPAKGLSGLDAGTGQERAAEVHGLLTKVDD